MKIDNNVLKARRVPLIAKPVFVLDREKERGTFPSAISELMNSFQDHRTSMRQIAAKRREREREPPRARETEA